MAGPIRLDQLAQSREIWRRGCDRTVQLAAARQLRRLSRESGWRGWRTSAFSIENSPVVRAICSPSFESGATEIEFERAEGHRLRVERRAPGALDVGRRRSSTAWMRAISSRGLNGFGSVVLAATDLEADDAFDSSTFAVSMMIRREVVGRTQAPSDRQPSFAGSIRSSTIRFTVSRSHAIERLGVFASSTLEPSWVR